MRLPLGYIRDQQGNPLNQSYVSLPSMSPPDLGGPAQVSGQVRELTQQERDALMNEARRTEAQLGSKAAMDTLNQRLKDAQDAAMKSATMQNPQRGKVSGQELMWTGLADFAREVFSNAPRSQRQQIPSGAQTLQGLKDQDYQQALRQSEINYQNEQNALLARQRAADIGLRGAEVGLDQANRTLDRTDEGRRFDLTHGLSERQFEFSREQWNADVNYRNMVFNENKRQFQEQLNWDKEKFNTTEWSVAQREFEQMVDSGLDVETAKARAFGKYIIQDQQIKLGDMSVKEKEQMMKLLPAQIADQLAEYEYNKKIRPLNLDLLRKQVQNYGRGGATDPLKTIDGRLAQLDTAINAAMLAKAGASSRVMGKDDKVDLSTYDKYIEYLRQEKRQVMKDGNYVAGSKVYPVTMPGEPDYLSKR